jgi:hypothetical protein
VERNTILWAIVVFFGATVLFGAIGRATEDEGTGVRLALQAAAGLVLVGLLVAWVRRSDK